MKELNDYQMKQLVANTIVRYAMRSRCDRNAYEYYTDLLSSLLDKVMKLDVFAAKVAETVDKSMCKGYNVANVSSKQAWVIACAVVENNIDTTHFLEFDQENDDNDDNEEEEETAVDVDKLESIRTFVLLNSVKCLDGLNVYTFNFEGKQYTVKTSLSFWYAGDERLYTDGYYIEEAYKEIQNMVKIANNQAA